jgi:uncharacterized protein
MSKFKIIFLFTAIVFSLYSFLFEPQWIEVTHHYIKAPIEKNLKIVQISDLHTKGLGIVEEKMLKIIDEIGPDIIVLTGDISSPGSTASDYFDVLSRLKSSQGIYFVNGNWEYWASIVGFNDLLSKIGIINLDNANIKISKNLWLIGFDDALEGEPNAIRAFKKVPKTSYKIGIFHTPIYFDSIHDQVNLALSGHTHGGQVKLPFLPPFWLPNGSSNYVSGWFKKGKSSMYVSRGIGMSILPLRLFCRPEIAVFHLTGRN